MQDTKLRLYAIRDKKSGNFVSNITNPEHKFWENKSACESAIQKYKKLYEFFLRGTKKILYNPDDLELVELFCLEKPEELKVAESILPSIEEMRDFTPEEEAVYRKHIDKISKPIIGIDGKSVNIFDLLGD